MIRLKQFLYNINNLQTQVQNMQMAIQQNKQVMDYRYYKHLHPDYYADELKEWYNNITGKTLNLENPQTFNEKIQWIKLYDGNPLKTRLADKYLVRDWITNKIGGEYLIPLLGVWDRFDDIDFDKLPAQFVIKANHGSAWNYIVKDKNTFNINSARINFNKWMDTDYSFCSGFELHYGNIKRKIIIEKYLENKNGKLNDYKIMCFNGKPKYIWVDLERYSGHKRNVFDLNWNLLPLEFCYKNTNKTISKPVNLEKMLKYSELLSQEFCHVRIDFYEVDDRLYFGEMTFTSHSGLGKFTPDEWDFRWGQLMDLSKGIKYSPNKPEFT
jgi:hypothetical protein